MATEIGSQVVTFTTTGLEGVQAAMERVRASMTQFEHATTTALGAVETGSKRAGAALAGVGDALKSTVDRIAAAGVGAGLKTIGERAAAAAQQLGSIVTALGPLESKPRVVQALQTTFDLLHGSIDKAAAQLVVLTERLTTAGGSGAVLRGALAWLGQADLFGRTLAGLDAIGTTAGVVAGRVAGAFEGIRPAVDSLSGLLDRWAGRANGAVAEVSGRLAGLAASTRATITGALTSLGASAAGVAAQITGTLGTALAGLAAHAVPLRAALDLGAIGATVAAVAGRITAAFTGVLPAVASLSDLTDRWAGRTAAAVGAVVAMVSGAATALADTVTAALGAIDGSTASLAGRLGGALGAALAGLAGYVVPLGAALAEVQRGFADLGPAAQRASSALAAALDQRTAASLRACTALVNQLGQALGNLGGAAAAVGAVAGQLSAAAGSVSSLTATLAKLPALLAGAGTWFAPLTAALAKLPGLLAHAPTWFAPLTAAARQLGPILSKALGGNLLAVVQQVGTAVGRLAQTFGGLSSLGPKLAGLLGSLLQGGSGLGAGLGSLVSGLMGSLGQSLAAGLKRAGPQVTGAIGNILASLPGIGAAAKSAFDQLLGAAGNAGNGAKQSAGGFSVLLGVLKSAGGVLGSVANAFQRTTQAALASPAAIGAAVAGFQSLTGAARRWAEMGLQNTNYGNALALQYQLLSQQIASVFVPTIQAVTNAVRALANWFRGLTGTQQTLIRHFVEAAAVMLVANRVIGTITRSLSGFVGAGVAAITRVATTVLTVGIPAFTSFVTAIVSGSMTIGTALGFATAGLSMVLSIAAAVVGVVASLGIAGATVGTGIVAGTETGRTALGQLVASLQPLLDALRATYRTVASTIGPALESLGATLGGVLGQVGGVVARLLVQATPLIERLGALLGQVAVAVGASFAQSAAVVLPVLERIGGRVLQTISALMPTIQAFGRGFVFVLTGIGEIARGVFTFFAPLVDRVMAAGVRAWAAFSRLFAVMERIAEASMRVYAAITRLGISMSGVGDIIGMAFDIVVAAVEDFANRLNMVADVVQAVVVPVINGLIQTIAGLVDALATAASAWDTVFGGHRADAVRRLATELRAIRVDLRPDALPANVRRKAEDPARTQVSNAPSGFEGAEALFKRATEASTKNDAENRRARHEGRVETLLDTIAGHTRPRPATRSVSPHAGTVGGAGVPSGLIGGSFAG